MNSYLVRIYREEEDNPRNFVGTVEKIGDEDKRAFTSLDELWAILNPAKKKSKAATGGSAQGKNNPA
jgi:hypothetical protein